MPEPRDIHGRLDYAAETPAAPEGYRQRGNSRGSEAWLRSDQEIVQACLTGESEAFATLVERYGERLFNLSLRIVSDRDAAADCAQEAFIRAYRALHQYDPARPFAPWLYRIATNASINYAQRWHAHEEPTAELPELPTPEETSPEAIAVSREQLSTVLAAIVALPPRYRAALTLRHMHGLSYQEVADALGIPLGTVKTHLHRARAALRAELQRRGVPWGRSQ